MDLSRTALHQAAVYLTLAAATAALVSIAACQILIGLAFAVLLLSRARLRFPPIKLPLALFFLGTLLSLALSEDPAAGLPQIRKFYVFLTLPIVYTAFRGLADVWRQVFSWVLAGGVSAAVALGQFLLKWKEAGELGYPFYQHYVGARITGFMSHWQTFGGEMMLVFLLLAAWLFFAGGARRGRLAAIAVGGVIAAAIVLGFTRNIWLGTFAGGLYLLWYWRRKLILLAPVVLVLVLAFGPASLRERFTSLVRPHGEVDSNQHRIVTFRTGLRMIEAHPFFGLGPEHVGIHFEEYVPADVPRPLPEGWYGHLHNIYLQYAAERGIPTLLCLLWLLGRVLYDCTVALRRQLKPEGAWVLRGAVAGVIGIMAAGLFEMNLGDSEVLTLFLAIIACAYVVIGEAGSEQAGEKQLA